jgi:predicted porin
MYDKNISRLAAGIIAAGAVASGTAQAWDFSAYGSLRIQVESVQPDDETTLDSYTGWRDAYSRIGAKLSHDFSDTATGYAQLELPLDIPNLEIQDPWDQDTEIRIAKIGFKGNFGDLAIGKMWMPYYNAIAYPVDMFSSYYSGFATYTTFRKGDTVSYYTPSFNGLSGAVAYSLENGALKASGKEDDRVQATVSYALDGLTLSGGLDHLGGVNDARIWGVAAAWQVNDALYIGAKYEVHDSDISSGYGADGDVAMNLYAGYSFGNNTVKGMIANVENYGETILHFGWDYQYNPDLKLFLEYYSEEETAAITTRGGGAAETCWACDGGYVIAGGVRFDFSTP